MYRGSFTQYPDTAVFESIDVGYMSVHARVIAVCARAGDRRITAVVWYTAVRVRSLATVANSCDVRVPSLPGKMPG